MLNICTKKSTVRTNINHDDYLQVAIKTKGREKVLHSSRLHLHSQILDFFEKISSFFVRVIEKVLLH
jgi:hypothetical protein